MTELQAWIAVVGGLLSILGSGGVSIAVILSTRSEVRVLRAMVDELSNRLERGFQRMDRDHQEIKEEATRELRVRDDRLDDHADRLRNVELQLAGAKG